MEENFFHEQAQNQSNKQTLIRTCSTTVIGAILKKRIDILSIQLKFEKVRRAVEKFENDLICESAD